MSYFVTGATGFIGRNLVERLLAARGHDLRPGAGRIARAPGGAAHRLGRRRSPHRPDRRRPHPARPRGLRGGPAGDAGRDRPLLPPGGDLRHDRRRRDAGGRQRRGDPPRGRARRGDRGRLLPPGQLDRRRRPLQGRLARGHVRGGRTARHQSLLPHQARVRAAGPRGVPRPWRVYRPGIVVGDSRTGEIDKIDGPYYFFKALQRARRVLPSWLPTVGIEGGEINIVPVDYVAAAIDHIAHKPRPRRPRLPPHRPQPEDRRRGDQPLRPRRRRAADGAAARLRRDRAGDRRWCAAAAASPAGQAGGEAGARPGSACRPGCSPTSTTRPTSTRPRRRRRWRARGSRCRRWRATPTGSGTTGSATSTPTSSRTARCRAAVRGKVVLITGASSGIGKATAVKVADAGATVLLVARSVEKLEETKDGDRRRRRHRPHPPLRHVRHRGHRADGRGGARLPRPRRHPRQQRRPLDPPLGRALLRPLPRLRADDPAQLPRRPAADPGPAADDAGPQVGPHHQHQLDRDADQPAALLRLRRLEGGARRLQPGDRLRGDRRRAST